MTGKSNVAEVEWLVKTEGVAVRINTLAGRQGTPWHFHTVIDDDIFSLEDPIEVQLRDPGETARLLPGQRQHVVAGRVHRVVNLAASPIRYLLIQATGPYDFIQVED
jgi:quercetin dioxygenase-like cupin family protein